MNQDNEHSSPLTTATAVVALAVVGGLIAFASYVRKPALANLGDMLCITEEHLISGVEVKQEPNRESETVMTIGAGRAVLELGREDGWLFVGIERGGGRDGFIPEASVSPKDLDGLPCGS